MKNNMSETIGGPCDCYGCVTQRSACQNKTPLQIFDAIMHAVKNHNGIDPYFEMGISAIRAALQSPASEGVDVEALKKQVSEFGNGSYRRGWNDAIDWLAATGHLRQPGGERQDSSGAYGCNASPYEGSEPVSNVGSPELRTDTLIETMAEALRCWKLFMPINDGDTLYSGHPKVMGEDALAAHERWKGRA